MESELVVQPLITGMESFQCPNYGLYRFHSNEETKKKKKKNLKSPWIPIECHVSKDMIQL